MSDFYSKLEKIANQANQKKILWTIDVAKDDDGNPQITLPDNMGLMKDWTPDGKVFFLDEGNGNWRIINAEMGVPEK